ncbi:MAG: hypothetical protein HUN04_18225 [Desulfobacter sp.]|nr:MAG: hypothetical protein HUN04_18225 [Desulfobacter sp.]
MKILIHADTAKKEAAVLGAKIQNRLPGIRITGSGSMAELEGAVGRPLNNIDVLVIFIKDERDLENLFSLASFLDNKKLILMLSGPDSRRAVTRGLQLHPSFIGSADTGEAEILEVLEQISRRRQAMKKTNNISQYLDIIRGR